MKSNSFEDYLLKEYPVSGCVCVNFKYSHGTKEKIDKKSKIPVINNVINVKIDCYDDKHNLLDSHSEKFIDGHIQRPKNKQLVNIAPAELDNRFSAVNVEICSTIMAEYMLKLDEINSKISALRAYCGGAGVIPSEFVNEPIIGEHDKNLNERKTKSFEF